MSNSAENDQINENEISCTPRRSLRISFASRLARQQPAIETKPEENTTQDEETSIQPAPNEHSSGEKNNENQKKRNKKSKKQKAKANKKRKQVKKSSSDSAHSETLESDRSLPEATEPEVEVEIGLPQTKSEPEEIASGSPPDESIKILHEIVDKEISVEKEIKKVESSLSENEIKSEPEEIASDTAKPDGLQDSTEAEGDVDLSQSEIPVEMHEATPQSKNLIPIATVKPISVTNSTKALKFRSPRFSSTPRNSILDRKKTPLKAARSSSVKKSALISDTRNATPAKKAVIAALIDSPLVTPIVAKMVSKTPLKSALRSRRSQSLGPDDLNTTSKKKSIRVVFNSPLNTTMNIDEVDFLMKSKQKLNVGADSSGLDESNVTVRRKRSMSVVETNSEKRLLINEPACDETLTKKPKRNPTPNSRVKLPNFTAIHQQSFDKMESIVDHVARKAERAKVLSTSKSKPQTGINEIQSVGKSNEPDELFKDLGIKPLNTIVVTEPRVSKARQKIELSTIKVVKKVPPSANKTIATNERNKKATTVESIGKNPVLPPVRKMNEKMADRHQKHLSLYKNNTTGTNNSTLRDERKEFIVGVRSNRRFVLQMQHRDRLK